MKQQCKTLNMFSLWESSLGEVAFNICVATLMLSDSAKEEEKLRILKMSDLRGWNSWCSGFSLMFISWGHDSHHDEGTIQVEFCLHWLSVKLSGFWQRGWMLVLNHDQSYRMSSSPSGIVHPQIHYVLCMLHLIGLYWVWQNEKHVKQHEDHRMTYQIQL